MKKVDLGEWHTKFRTEYDPKLIFQECSDRESAIFSWSLYLLFQSFPLMDQPYRKKTGRFFINLQKKYFKTKHNQNVKVERNILAYSLLLILREFLRLEKLSKQDLLMLIIFATAHYIRLIDGEEKEKMELGHHVRDIYDDNYNLIKSKSPSSRLKLVNLLYESFDLNINDEKKNRENISLLAISAIKAEQNINVVALNEYRKAIKNIKKYS